jgi:hypothetical protein
MPSKKKEVKKDPLEFDSGFGMFDYKPSASSSKPKETYATAAPMRSEPEKAKQWKPGFYKSEKQAQPEEEEGGFSWEKGQGFEFEEASKPTAPVQPPPARVQKPANTPQVARSYTVPIPQPQPPPAPAPAPVPVAAPVVRPPEKKEVKKAPAPAMIDLLQDTNPQMSLPEDLFDVEEPPKMNNLPPPMAPIEESNSNPLMEEPQVEQAIPTKPQNPTMDPNLFEVQASFVPVNEQPKKEEPKQTAFDKFLLEYKEGTISV